MKVLALDTSTKEASVAVVENNILLGEYTLNHNKTHSQNLVPMINDLLLNLGLEAKDIDMFAVSIGPGSFTGLRIGVVTAKALAYALDKAIIGIPTLDVLAYNIPFCQNIICPIIDARNNRVYTALYKWTLDKKERFTKYMAIRIDELAQILKESTRDSEQKVIFLGDGLKAYRSFFLDELGETSVFAPP
jgi:tRNA threonylcarbamoyladenosine biosynthesis protein TsaB